MVNVKKLRERRRTLHEAMFEILNDKSMPFEQRMIHFITVQEKPRNEWIRSQEEDLLQNDERIELLRTIAAAKMAVFSYSQRRSENEWAFGNGLLVCTLDENEPWSVEKVEPGKNAKLYEEVDVRLMARPVLGSAFALLPATTGLRTYGHYGYDEFTLELPCVVPVEEVAIPVQLPKEQSGIEHFAERVRSLGEVAGVGVGGLVDLATKLEPEHDVSRPDITVLHAALKHFSQD